MADNADKALRALRESLDRATRKGRLKEAVAASLELERLEPRSPRWPHKRGDLLRKLGSRPEAVQAYALAAELYMDQGFLPRAIAMAKVILEVDPERTEVLQRLDPSAARALHREARPQAVHVDGELVRHSLQESVALVGEAFPATEVTELELSDVELADAAPEPAATDTGAAPDAATPSEPIEHELRAEAHRLASLPLFPLFTEIPREAMLVLARESRLRTLAEGDTLLRAGDPADALFGIVAGQLEVRVPGASPAAPIRLGEGEVLGESCLLGDEPRRADVVATGPSLVLEIPKSTLNYLVRVHPGLGEILLELLTRRLLGNLLRTARPFRGLDGPTRKRIAALFSVRRARGGTELLRLHEAADALYITLTGHVEVSRAPGQPVELRGAGTMFGQQSLLGGAGSEVGVRTRENQLVLMLPSASFAQLAMEHFQVLSEIAELDAVAGIGG